MGQSEPLEGTLVSKNVTVGKKRTSIRLEPQMWDAVCEIAQRENCSVHDICSMVDLRKQQGTSLTAGIRVFIMLYFKAAATEEGHRKAGHGDFKNMVQRARINAETLPNIRHNARSFANRLCPMKYKCGDLCDDSRPAYAG